MSDFPFQRHESEWEEERHRIEEERKRDRQKVSDWVKENYGKTTDMYSFIEPQHQATGTSFHCSIDRDGRLVCSPISEPRFRPVGEQIRDVIKDATKYSLQGRETGRTDGWEKDLARTVPGSPMHVAVSEVVRLRRELEELKRKSGSLTLSSELLSGDHPKHAEALAVAADEFKELHNTITRILEGK